MGTDWETDPGKRLNGKIKRSPQGKNTYGDWDKNIGDVVWKPTGTGRYPANLVLQHAHDCDETGCGRSCPVKLMGEQSGECKSGENKPLAKPKTNGACFGKFATANVNHFPPSTGTAARYFTQIHPDPDPFHYSGKATKKDRTCNGAVPNAHPTVKPRALIEHLIKLIMPPSPDAIVIDPFSGSGTTGVAAKELGRNAILIEREPEYIKLIRDRLDATESPDTGQLPIKVRSIEPVQTLITPAAAPKVEQLTLMVS